MRVGGGHPDRLGGGADTVTDIGDLQRIEAVAGAGAERLALPGLPPFRPPVQVGPEVVALCLALLRRSGGGLSGPARDRPGRSRTGGDAGGSSERAARPSLGRLEPAAGQEEPVEGDV